MNKILNSAIGLIFFTSFLQAAPTRVQRKEGGQFHTGAPSAETGHRAPAPPVVIKMQRYYMPSPQVITNPRHTIHDRESVVVPRQDDRGLAIQQRQVTVAPNRHTSIVRNTKVIRNIERERHVEVVPNRYYWHTHNDVRYCHTYYRGSHWYGFYFGPSFYWTRYYSGYWWWFDINFNRWVYWWNGYWWWPGPHGAAYVFIDNNYYPYEGGVVTVTQPEVQAPPVESPEFSKGNSYTSPDDKRIVQVYGTQSEAFLYDNSSGKPVFLKYLGQGVENVRFAGGENSTPLQILVDFKDGKFALFNAEGEPQDSSKSLSESSPPAVSPPPIPSEDELPAPPPQK